MKRSIFIREGNWYKGNIHSHTTMSDGLCPPEKQINDYRAMGYHFLSITDHNVMYPYAAYSCDNFLMLPGWERDIPYGPTKCIHLVGLFPENTPANAEKRLPRGDAAVMTQQMLVDEMREANQYTVLAHPVWSRMEPEEIKALDHLDAIEVFNTGTERLCHAGHAAVYWDVLLRQGKRIWGIACDDTHGKTLKSDRFCGWVMAKAARLDQGSILAALRSGSFYASTGPEIYDFFIEDGYVHVSCSPCEEIDVISYPPRGLATYALDKQPLTNLKYLLKGEEAYVRIECVDANGNTAWSNPIFL